MLPPGSDYSPRQGNSRAATGEVAPARSALRSGQAEVDARDSLAGEAMCETTSDGAGQPYTVSPAKTKIIGDIQVTSSASIASHATGSQKTSSRVRVLSVDTVRRKRNWHW